MHNILTKFIKNLLIKIVGISLFLFFFVKMLLILNFKIDYIKYTSCEFATNIDNKKLFGKIDTIKIC